MDVIVKATRRIFSITGRGARGAPGPTGPAGGNVMAIGLFTAATGMVIPAGTKVVQTSGYRTLGQGPGRYVQDDVLVTAGFVTAHPTWCFRAVDEIGASHGWKLAPNDDGAVLFDTFGAYGDATFHQGTGAITGTDDFPAWQGMDDYLATTAALSTNPAYRSLIPVRFGRRYYRFSSPLSLKAGSYGLLGSAASGAQNGGYGTVLVMAGLRGITLEYYMTSGDNAVTSTGAAGSTLSDLTLLGASSVAGLNRHGIWDRCGGNTVTNVKTMYFPDDGIRIDLGDGGGNANLGLSDNGLYQNIISSFNNGNGIKCSGGDSNANTFVNVVTNSNRLFGKWENSFLGNTWIGGQEDGNGSAVAGRPWDAAGPSAFCSYGGKQYGVIAGQDGAASTIVPGTDATIWYYFGDGGASEAIPTWVTGMTWKSGGASLYDNPNAPVAVLGKYKEGGLGLIQNPAGRAVFFNGIAAQSVLGGKGAIYASNGIIQMPGGAGTISSMDPTYGQTVTQQGSGNSADGAGFKVMNSVVAPDGFAWSFNFVKNAYSLRYGGADPEMILCAGPSSTMTYGRSNPVLNPAVQISSLFVGAANNARQITVDAAAPTAGDHGRGDIVFNLNAAASGFAGWICVAAGTPGTWKTFGAISA